MLGEVRGSSRSFNLSLSVLLDDNYGQLGLCSENEEKTTEKQTIPFLCCFNVVITSVACGEEHSAFITDEGNVYTMGSNLEGRLGIGNKQLRSVNMPCLVEILVGYFIWDMNLLDSSP